MSISVANIVFYKQQRNKPRKRCAHCGAVSGYHRVRRSWFERLISQVFPFKAYQCGHCHNRFYWPASSQQHSIKRFSNMG